MAKQLTLFPASIFSAIRANEGPAYIHSLETKIERLERSLAAYKAHFTKQKKKANKHE